MAQLPTPAPQAIPAQVSTTLGDESSPTIVVSPNNPNKLVAVFTNINDPNRTPTPPITKTVSGAAFSTNGGTTWTPFTINPTEALPDPSTTNPTIPFSRVTDSTVAIDHNDRVYILNSQHNDANNSGALVLNVFNFAGNTPARVVSNSAIHRWTTNAAHDPVISVDDTVPTFTDPQTGQTVDNTNNAGHVYVSWVTTDTNPSLFTDLANFNPNRVALITSSDGGLNFSSAVYPANGNFGTQRFAAPRVAVSQGTTDGRITPGGVTVVWDDFGSGATANPPADFIRSEDVAPGTAARFTTSNVPINDSPGGTPPVVVTTDVTFNVTAAGLGNTPGNTFTTLNDLDVRLAITHPGMDQVSITLIPPVASGRGSVTLVNASIPGATPAVPGTLTGANLGIINGFNVGTVFDDSATRNIFDPNTGGTNANTSPYIDNYRPLGGSLAGAFAGMTATAGPDGLIGTWTIRLTDNAQNTGAVQFVNSATLIMNSRFQADAAGDGDNAVATSFVLGGLDGIGRTAIAASPRAIGPAPVIASDNTLGSFSPHQGRLYASYVNYIHPTVFSGNNPADNTDIHLAVSDDGGLTWTAERSFFNPVNNDAGITDGYSGAIIDPLNTLFDGRPQFMPSVAVDQSTGTLVMSWYDARWDAARARVATYVSSSLDGGQTFNDVQTYASADYSVVNPLTGGALVGGGIIDSVTNRPVNPDLFGPLPENQSAGNPIRDTVLGYGTRTGLAAAGGRAFPIWSGNQNFAGINIDGANGSQRLDIYTNRTAIGGGPRVLSVTSGTVTPSSERVLADGSNVFYNNLTDADGSLILDGLVATFDRPIYFNPTAPIDPVSFGVDDVRVFYRDATSGNTNGTAVAVEQIIPLIDPTSPLSTAQQLAFGASRYLIRLAPRTNIGTYSVQIGPNYSDRIRTANADGSLRSAGNRADQNADGVQATPLTNGAVTANVDVFMSPTPVGTTVSLFNNAANPSDPRNGMVLAPFASDSLPLVLSAPSVEYVTVPGEPFTDRSQTAPTTPAVGDTLAVDRVVQGLDVTFDRDMQVGSFTPADVLRADGPAGPISGPFTVRPAYRQAVAQPIPDNGIIPPALNATIVVPDDGGAFVIADLDVELDIRHPKASELTITLVAPDGTTVVLASGLGGAVGKDYRDTIFDSGGTLDGDTQGRQKKLDPITVAIPPFTGRYKPMNPLSVLNGKQLRGVWTLRVQDATGNDLPVGQVQQLLSWSISAVPTLNSPDVVARTFRVEFFEADGNTILPAIQKTSGTYGLTLSPDIVSARGDKLDTDHNAGLDFLRGLDPAGNTIPVLVTSTDTPISLTDATVGATGVIPGVTSSTISVTDDFLIQDINLKLTINHPRVQDLTAVLINPAGDRVTLFSPTTLRVNGANFTGTVFDDAAPTFIFDGGPPYFGSFAPEQPLSRAFLDSAGNPRRSAGNYTLEITDSRVGSAGILADWSLTFAKPQTGDGLGETVADRAHADFRVFTMDPTNPTASNNWTPVGPASVTAEAPGNGIQNRWAGRIGAIAVDPSDPTGNTVYVAGASGGIWRTTNFLTADPAGPSYIPLTDFGPNQSLNIGSLAVFGRDGDPNRSIIFAATGEGDDSAGFGTNQTGRGIGFLRSMDGGRTWQVLDSTNNVSGARDRAFIGSTAFKVVVDPKLSSQNQVIVYAALAGRNGGLWRSFNGGDTWEKKSVDNVQGTQATDIILDPYSADATTGNLDRFYIAFRDTGVFRATSRGDNLTFLAGGVGKPLVQDPDAPPDSIDVIPGVASPPTGGRIVLAQVRPTGIPSQDISYQDWLYVADVEAGAVAAIYSTKDRGENWTRIAIPITNNEAPTNDSTQPSIDLSPGEGLDGNFAISIAVDPNNPQVVYLGANLDGSSATVNNVYTLLRLDTTIVKDGHNLSLYNPNQPDGGLLTPADNANAAATLKNVQNGFPNIFDIRGGSVPYTQAINLVRNPATPLAANATYFIRNVASFNNNGTGVNWTPFDDFLQGANGVHDLFTIVDPISGKSRLIAGTDQGVFSAAEDGRGHFVSSIGNDVLPMGTRNGNLQIAQIHYGAAQPSNLAAQVADSLFWAGSWQVDFPASDGDILQNGNLSWTDRDPLSFEGSGSGVATAQVDDASRGAVYQYKWPSDGGRFTDFFQVNGVGRTVGLLQGQNDPQWFGLSPVISPGIRFGNFAVNPINNNQVLISSGVGRLYSTEDQGRTWRVIGDPSVFDGANLSSYAPAIAFGAPEPGVTAPGSLNDFLYVGDVNGRIFLTRTGGGAAGTEWFPISNGLDGSPVLNIITSPDRGTREAYAITQNGVFYTPDAFNLVINQATQWQNITGNLISLMDSRFIKAIPPDPNQDQPQLHTIVADWRYLLPEDLDNPTSRTHPILYAAGFSGVFRSLDNGATWTTFPDNSSQDATIADGSPADVGFLPNVRVTDLDLSLGFINPTNGRPVQAGTPNVLLASTFGRGQFAIRLAPLVLEDSVRLSATLPAPDGSDSGISAAGRLDRVTNVVQPFIEGISEQTAFGNVVRVTLLDLTDPTKPRIIGGFDPANPATDILANQTDDKGRFSIQINAGVFAGDGSTDGPKVIGVQTVNLSGTQSNIVNFHYTLDTTKPPASTAPDLTLASDSGQPNFPNNDNYTNDSSPTFSVGNIEAGNTVFLYRNGVIVTTINNAAAGTISITDLGPVADGVYTYTVKQVDQAANEGPFSAPLSVTIDTTLPAIPSAPTLLTLDDTGVQGDGITSNTRPRLTGAIALGPNETSADNLPLIQLLDAAGFVLGSTRANPDGSYTIRFDQPQIDGTYVVQVQAIDRAGNTSGTSAGSTITIKTSAPPAVSLALSPQDDTGTQGDNSTSIRRPRLIGVTGAGLTVQLIDEDGQVTGTPGGTIGAPVLSLVDGRFTLQFPTLLVDGTYRVTARATDAAGNSSFSPTLLLTIDSTAPVGAPDLRLDPNSDTGRKGDGHTSNRRPFLVGTTDPNAAVEIVGPTGDVLASGFANAQGAFSLQLASNLVNGSIALRSRSRDTAGNLGPFSNPFNLTIETTYGDYDADGKADLDLFRPDATADKGTFLFLRSTLGAISQDFGRADDLFLSADFDGDGINDIVTFRGNSDLLPGASQWFILGSRTGARSIFFGGAGLDLPAPADYDGDGIADLAVFRPNSDLVPGASEWFILGSRSGPLRFQFGKAGDDVPVPADYDGDGKADLAVFRPASDLVPGSAQWFVAFSGGGAMSPAFGQANLDLPVPGDYDGDGKADVATYRPNTSQWFVKGSLGVTDTFAFGAPGDVPAPADYDNDGKFDLGLYRAATGQWNYRASTTTASISVAFGGPKDIPILSPLAYRDQRPGTIVSPRSDLNNLDGARAIGLSTDSVSPAGSNTTATNGSMSLDLGASAVRLSASSTSTGGSTATTPRTRPAQALAAKKAAQQQHQSNTTPTQRGVLGWFQRRRLGSNA
jgi:large repetitive protein